MSRKRAKYLVELTKKKHNVSDNCDINDKQIDETHERVSSPLRDGKKGSNELMAMFDHVFDEPIEVDTSFSSLKKTRTTYKRNFSPIQTPIELDACNNSILIEDVNLNLTASESPVAESSMVSGTDQIQRVSPMAMTPISIEPLLSVITNNEDQNSKKSTPVPSPCDFITADDTLIPSTSRNVDITLTTENAQEILGMDQLACNNDENFQINSVSEITSVCSSVCSTTTFNESGYTEQSTPKNKRKSNKRTDAGSKRLKHKEHWVAIKRKRLCNIGKSYTSTKGITKGARKMKSSCNSCRLHCGAKISDTLRSELFTNFCSTGSHIKQWKLIA